MVSSINYFLINDIKKAIKKYSQLDIKIFSSKITVIGQIPLVDKNIGEFDKYDVNIHFPNNYPYRFPIVVETSNKIPRIPDRHINSNDYSLCLAVLPEELKITKNGITFLYFLDRILVPHLSRETYFGIEKRYPNGEYDHGIEGIWKYFQEILEITDRNEILFELKKITSNKMIGRNEICTCGSGIKFKKCHLSKWNRILETGKENLNEIIKTLTN